METLFVFEFSCKINLSTCGQLTTDYLKLIVKYLYTVFINTSTRNTQQQNKQTLKNNNNNKKLQFN